MGRARGRQTAVSTSLAAGSARRGHTNVGRNQTVYQVGSFRMVVSPGQSHEAAWRAMLAAADACPPGLNTGIMVVSAVSPQPPDTPTSR